MEDETLKVIFMMASAGLLSGDRLSYDIVCGEGTKSELTEQSYTKIFECNGAGASKTLTLSLEKNAELYYHPCPVIPFQNSCFDSKSEIYLDSTARFSYSEIFAAGRIAMGERFAFRHFKNRVTVYVDDKPVLLDNVYLEPASRNLESMFSFDGYTHQGSFYYYSDDSKLLDRLYHFPELPSHASETPQGDVLFAASHPKAGIFFRALSNQAQNIEELFSRIQEFIWQ